MKKNIITWGIAAVFVVILGFAVLYRVIQQNQSRVESSERMQVVASFYPLAHIAEQVGKEHVDVVNLTPAGSEPHDFDPSPRDIAMLQTANVFIYNGAGLEPWASRIIPELEGGVRVVEASKGLALLAGVGHEEDGDGENVDPHTWLDPVLLQQEVMAVAAAFAQADSVHTKDYEANAKAYIANLTTLHQDFARGLAQCTHRDIVTSHAAFAYLAKRHALNMVSISGLSPEVEPSPGRLAEVADIVRERQVTHIFFETLVSPKLAQTIASETGAVPIALNPLEGLSGEEIASGKTYISVQRENLQALKIALGCT